MAYTNVWNDTLPTGAEAANTLDNIIRGLKTDIDQRFVDMLAIPAFNADPLRSGGMRFIDSANAVFFLGDAGAGSTRSLTIKDKTGTSSYINLNNTNITILLPTIVEGLTFSSFSLKGLADSADQITWKFANGVGGPGDGVLALLAVNDANNASNSALTISRSGTTVGAWSHFGTKFTFNNRVISKADVTSAIAYSVVSDGGALNSLDLAATNTLGQLIYTTNPNTSSSWSNFTSSVQQLSATSGSTYGSHLSAHAANTSGTNAVIHGVGIVVGASGSGGTTTTLNGLSINCVASAGATITTYNGLFFFSPSGAGTLSNTKAINISNMGTGNNQFAIITGTGLVQLGDQIICAASTVSRASLRIPTGVAPSFPADGELWQDGTNVKIFVNGATKTFTLT